MLEESRLLQVQCLHFCSGYKDRGGADFTAVWKRSLSEGRGCDQSRHREGLEESKEEDIAPPKPSPRRSGKGV